MKNQSQLLIGGAILLLLACQTASKEMAQKTSDPQTINYYSEAHRPQFHFSPESMWTNDPNGMVYYEGEYHLFYQHYPDSAIWGPMHWGHAISTDLVHWKHLPIALFPDSLGLIFSGSAVVDHQNTSGFGKDDKAPLVAIYTYHDMAKQKAGREDVETQGIAYSNDRGRTWTKYEGNPVILSPPATPDFRDPKVIWDASRERWLMALAEGDHTQFFRSENLKDWTPLSEFGQELGAHGGVWECPDFFPMQVEGTDETKWVLIKSINPGGPNGGSATQYFVGDFDGTNFTLDPQFEADVPLGTGIWIDEGKDNYAGVSFSDIPQADGRRIFIGWMSNWQYANVVPTQAWRNAMTIPRTLRLYHSEAGYRIKSTPVKELEKLRMSSYAVPAQSIEGDLPLSSLDFGPSQSEVILEFDLATTSGGTLGIELKNAVGESYRIGYDVAKQMFFSDRTEAGDKSFSKDFAAGLHTAERSAGGDRLKLHLFLDVASVELFADEGATVMTEIFFPTEPFDQISLFASDGVATLLQGTVYQLENIWL